MFDPSENGLHGMSDYEQIEDESFPPLPPPLSPGEGNFGEESAAIGEGEDGELSRLPDVPVAKRRTVKRPQPKLDSHRLISERGLPALRTLFTDVKFKGKGHEAEDLKVLMQKMENWAHRLYPKLQFEDFIQKLESLGGKKEVQTCLKRIRLDMPLTHEDFIGNDGGGDEADAQLQEDGEVFEDQSFSEDPFLHSTPALTPLSLTEEQQQRIERNKQLALERKLARQKQLESSQSASPEEPAASPIAPRLSRDEQKETDQTTDNTDTPSKQDPAEAPSSSQCNRCDSPVPELTNDTDYE